MAMDSPATFASRLRDLGLSEFSGALEARGWTTLAGLAFAAGSPGLPSTEAALDERVIAPVLGAVDHPRASQLRRLYFEAYTIAASEMRRRLDRGDEHAPRPLPTAEREARRQRLQKRLTGLEIKGDLDPAPSLVTAAYNMYEADAVDYIAWENCPKYSQEASRKTAKRLGWAPDASGVVKETAQSVAPTVTISTTHHLSNALIRRGLALEMGGIMTFEVHERLRRVLLNALSEEAPPGYNPASMVQLERADRYIFSELATDTREGVRGIAASGLPLDQFLDKHLNSIKLNMLLCPLAKGGSSSGASSSQQNDERKPGKTDKETRQQRQIENQKGQVDGLKRKQQQQTPRPNKAAKRPSDRKSSGSGPMPRELQGHLSSTAKGQICFAANTAAGCPHAALGGKCRRGWHICCHKQCKDREGHLFPQCQQH